MDIGMFKFFIRKIGSIALKESCFSENTIEGRIGDPQHSGRDGSSLSHSAYAMAIATTRPTFLDR
jgi:hypothetical protein